MRRQVGGKRHEGVLDLDRGLMVGTSPRQQCRQGADVVGAEDDVHPRGPGQDGVLVLLSHAPTDGQLHGRVLGLDGSHVAERSVETVVGVLPDGTGVEDDDVGRVQGVLSGVADIAGVLQQTGYPFGIVDIHLAPVGDHPIGRRSFTCHGGPTLRLR